MYLVIFVDVLIHSNLVIQVSTAAVLKFQIPVQVIDKMIKFSLVILLTKYLLLICVCEPLYFLSSLLQTPAPQQ